MSCANIVLLAYYKLWISVLCVTVFERYKSYSPYDMKESIRKEVKGDLEKSFLTLGMFRKLISAKQGGF